MKRSLMPGHVYDHRIKGEECDGSAAEGALAELLEVAYTQLLFAPMSDEVINADLS